MKRQLFSISGRGLQMKKLSQNKEENSVTPKYCKMGFKVWNRWILKPAELLVIIDREEFGECFLIRAIWLGNLQEQRSSQLCFTAEKLNCLAYQELYLDFPHFWPANLKQLSCKLLLLRPSATSESELLHLHRCWSSGVQVHTALQKSF